MTSAQFVAQMRQQQIAWRQQRLQNQKRGKQNAKYYDHILPSVDWELNLWPGIRQSLPLYLKGDKPIQRHVGSHNLLSSWALCANLYFPFREEYGLDLLTRFLHATLSPKIQAVTAVELEYQAEIALLRPAALLGETDGHQGAGQTSPDIAFLVDTESGPGVILVECKFTEHSFYGCAGRRRNRRHPMLANPDPTRCLSAATVVKNPTQLCHLCSWKRRYWDHLQSVVQQNVTQSLKACPAAYGGYQLFRQQALAEGLARSGHFSLVISAVAYDARNLGLMHCMRRSTGLNDIRTDWARLFVGQAQFAVFTHQTWVTWVAEHTSGNEWKDWQDYIRERYAM